MKLFLKYGESMHTSDKKIYTLMQQCMYIMCPFIKIFLWCVSYICCSFRSSSKWKPEQVISILYRLQLQLSAWWYHRNRPTVFQSAACSHLQSKTYIRAGQKPPGQKVNAVYSAMCGNISQVRVSSFHAEKVYSATTRHCKLTDIYPRNCISI